MDANLYRYILRRSLRLQVILVVSVPVADADIAPTESIPSAIAIPTIMFFFICCSPSS